MQMECSPLEFSLHWQDDLINITDVLIEWRCMYVVGCNYLPQLIAVLADVIQPNPHCGNTTGEIDTWY